MILGNKAHATRCLHPHRQLKNIVCGDTNNGNIGYWDTKRIYKYAGSFQRLQFIETLRIPLLKVGNTCMHAFYVFTDIQYYTGKEIEYQREPYC